MGDASFREPFNPAAARSAAAANAYPDSSSRTRDDWPTPIAGLPTVRTAPQPAEPSTEWMRHGNCSGRTDEMFPRLDSGEASNSQRYRAMVANAVAICTGCPVRTDCDDYAHSYQPAEGIWAGQVWYRGRPNGTHPRRKRPKRIAQNRDAPAYSLLTLMESATWQKRDAS